MSVCVLPFAVYFCASVFIFLEIYRESRRNLIFVCVSAVCVFTSFCVCLAANMSVCVNGQSVQLIALSLASPGGRCH